MPTWLRGRQKVAEAIGERLGESLDVILVGWSAILRRNNGPKWSESSPVPDSWQFGPSGIQQLSLILSKTQ
jgi:hypothetical protein